MAVRTDQSQGIARALSRWGPLLAMIAIITSAGMALSPVVSGDFVGHDDVACVTGNAVVCGGLTISGLRQAFSGLYVGHWSPLTVVSHMLVFQCFGLEPWAHHGANLVLHLVSVALLFAAWWIGTRSWERSWIVAALFAVHPLHVESVAWIAERKGVLANALGMLALLSYVVFARRPSLARYAAVATSLVAALMAKESMVVLPVLFLLLDVWPLQRDEDRVAGDSVAPRSGRFWAARVMEKIPLLGICVAVGVVAILGQRASGALLDVQEFPWHVRWGNVVISLTSYLGQAMWPTRLAVYYPLRAEDVTTLRVVTSAAILVCITSLVLYWWSRRYLAFGWLWYLVSILPLAGFIQVGKPQAMADRYTDVPLIGIYTMVVWGWAEVLQRLQASQRVSVFASVVILVVLSYVSHQQASHWHDQASLFLHAIEVTRADQLAYYNAGRGLRQRATAARAASRAEEGRQLDERAVEMYRNAIDLKPDWDSPHNELGIYHFQHNRMAQAEEEFRLAIHLESESGSAHNNLARVLVQTGRRREAVPEFREAVRLMPEDAQVANVLAWILATTPEASPPEREEAVALASRAVALSSGLVPSNLDTLAAALAATGRYRDAMEVAMRAARLAESQGRTKLLSTIEEHLRGFAEGRPILAMP